MKEIIAVFQDCVLCGVKGQKKIEEYAKKGVIIRKVGFTTPEGKDLIHEAVFNHKIGAMPFYTDGIKFSTKIDALSEEDNTPTPKIVKKVQKKAKTCKKTKKIDKEEDNGAISEA